MGGSFYFMIQNFKATVIVFLLALPWGLSAQNADLSPGIKEIQAVLASEQLVIIDSLTIAADKLRVTFQDTILPFDYHYSRDSLLLNFDEQTFNRYKNQSLTIRYRTLAYQMGQVFYKLDTSRLEKQKDQALYIGYDFSPYEGDRIEPLFAEGLDYDGSFSRGFAFGNNQSLNLQSDFNLQMAGNLGEDIQLKAAISDANIPIQAEGNTQQLQEFDKVFIELKRKNNQLIAGDYDLIQPEGYFLKYYKKLQGLSFQNTQNLVSQEAQWKTQASTAISRGKFSRHFIEQQEGNQGPYKLIGNEGERFLIVLAGTEKVYIDGELLTRGQEHDYIIQYDRAEIIFTPQRLITKDTRILIEFEYAVQNYLRSLVAANTSFEKENWMVYFNAYQEQDSKTSTGILELDSTDLAILRQAGDELQAASRTGISLSEDGFNPALIMYEKQFEPTISDSILVYSTDPEKALFTANFSDVGEGNGSYKIDEDTQANGRVYVWVGYPNGNYEPIIALAAPEQKQQFAVGGKYKLGKNGVLASEISLSRYDLNRYASLGDEDNIGLAGFAKYEQFFYLDKDQRYRLKAAAGVELVQDRYETLNPYRAPEFARDWNLNFLESANEFIGYSQIEFQLDKHTSIQYEYKRFDRTNQYLGQKHIGYFRFEKAGYNVNLKSDLLNTQDNLEKTQFFRPTVELSKSFEKLTGIEIGVRGMRERNARTNLLSDSLQTNSLFFDRYGVFLNSTENEKYAWGVHADQRVDRGVLSDAFALSTIANEVGLNGHWSYKSFSRLSWDFIHRDLEIIENQLTDETPLATTLGKLDLQWTGLKSAIVSNTSIQLGSGQEPKQEFSYEKTIIPGTGDYAWYDDGDGIEELGEFDIPVFSDQANYVRVYQFNNEFIRTNNNNLNQSLRLEPKKLWASGSPNTFSKKLFSKFSSQSNLRFIQKTKREDGAGFVSPFETNLLDTSLVSFRSFFNNTLYFNKGKSLYDIQIGNRNINSKIQQTVGYEARGSEEYFFRSRLNVGQKIDYIQQFSFGGQRRDSESFPTYNYAFEFIKVEPNINFRPNDRLRFVGRYIYENKTAINAPEKANIHNTELEINFKQTSKSSFNLDFSFANISYNGAQNTPLELAILDGLKNGNNFLWGVNYLRRMANNIDLNISYEGRKTGDVRIIHQARAQIKASF